MFRLRGLRDVRSFIHRRSERHDIVWYLPTYLEMYFEALEEGELSEDENEFG